MAGAVGRAETRARGSADTLVCGHKSAVGANFPNDRRGAAARRTGPAIPPRGIGRRSMTMYEDRLNQDSERASLLQHLLETPIGRRWLFKAGLSSAAAVALANVPVWSTPTGVLAQTAPGTGTGTGPSSSTGISLQFALGTPTSSASGGGLSDLTLIANGARLPLVAHTTDSRAALKAQGG